MVPSPWLAQKTRIRVHGEPLGLRLVPRELADPPHTGLGHAEDLSVGVVIGRGALVGPVEVGALVGQLPQGDAADNHRGRRALVLGHAVDVAAVDPVEAGFVHGEGPARVGGGLLGTEAARAGSAEAVVAACAAVLTIRGEVPLAPVAAVAVTVGQVRLTDAGPVGALLAGEAGVRRGEGGAEGVALARLAAQPPSQ